jgi:endonuclease/exonuclease/phosphatase family metal-dependent hydrolase
MSNNEKSNKSFVLGILFLINIIIALGLLGTYLSTHISPNTIPYLSLLGLAYPIFIWSILSFSFLWLFTRYKYLLFNILIFLLGLNHFNDFFTYNNSTTIHSSTALKLTSYNVRIFNFYDLKENINTRNNIFNFIKSEHSDIYCFQEFYHQQSPSNFKTRDTLITFLDTKNYHERYTHEMTGKKFFGLATFTKFPIVNKGGISFSNDANNYCIYTDILKGKDTLRIFNAHIGSIRLNGDDLNLFKDINKESIDKKEEQLKGIVQRLVLAFQKRAVQIEKIMGEVKKSPHPSILCGDFNDTPVSYCYKQITKQLNDAFNETANGTGKTYIGKIPSNRIDYIFHTDHLTPYEFKVHDVDYSDHKPISSYFDIIK